VPLGDVRGFTEAVRVLARNPDRRRALGRAGRERVEREFQGDVVIPRLVKVLAGDPC
jgi:glycosyltransferase involved in cell wall biosynthesis